MLHIVLDFFKIIDIIQTFILGKYSMEKLDKLCGELDIEINTLHKLDKIEKKQLYNLLKDIEIIQQGKETFGSIESFFNRLTTHHMSFGTKPLNKSKEEIINTL